MSESEKPTAAAVGKMKKEELKDLVIKLLDEIAPVGDVDQQSQEIMPMLRTILTEVRKGNEEREKLSKDIEELKATNNTLTKTLAQHQRFLEMLDNQQRANRLIIHGVPEANMTIENQEMTNDAQKIECILRKIDHDNRDVIKSRRLGQVPGNDAQKIRPIEVTLTSPLPRDKILQDAPKLNGKGEPFSRIRIKKDLHPAVRQEWKRLKDLEETEKARPENASSKIEIDYRKRVLLRDNVVISTWQPKFFQ